MKLFLVCPVSWTSFLVLWALQVVTEGNNHDICREEKDDYILTETPENFICVLYPTNLLNCSWSFHFLQKLSVYISICDEETTVLSLSQSSNERVGSRSLTVQFTERLYVVLQFNKTQDGRETVDTYTYEQDQLEVLPPPPNISATIKDGSLEVTWSPPNNESFSGCFDYQLDLGDQDKPKNLSNQLSYTERDTDPTRAYRVRIRTRKNSNCIGSVQWSEWSPTITLEQSVYKLNTLLIVSISLGVPMILLAVLLLVRHQRVSKLLFPPIPRPPAKYKYFLEKNDTFNFYHPAPSPKAEEITKVEDVD
ncbi:interleukin-13 receptor subunit alpha-1-like [Trachinotus anak]|uniref:interleukin-13 receptor subunit alpha-1-like n=1 Tax=Trachinotus anak TaxID=443729 RepID=UPI0039F20D7F